MMIAVADVIALSVLQGITEFLPVSSSGHLALAEILFGLKENNLALNVMLHAGTLCATLLVLRQRVFALLVAAFRAVRRPSTLRDTPDGRDVVAVVVATVPTAVLGLTLERPTERFIRSPLAVGIGFLITGLLLLSVRWARAGKREGLGLWGAAAVGVAQGIAVLPGISRSGSTIGVGLWLGVRPERAFELSMLMSLPAVFGAVVLEVPAVMGASATLGPAVVGAAVSFAVGVVALLVLRRVVVHGSFPVFALWVLPLAVATLALARAWPTAL
jgi:undecaprenyl-diphosphatase